MGENCIALGNFLVPILHAGLEFRFLDTSGPQRFQPYFLKPSKPLFSYSDLLPPPLCLRQRVVLNHQGGKVGFIPRINRTPEGVFLS